MTTDPDYYEEHTESVEFWSPGNPLFNAPENLHAPSEMKGAQQLGKLLDEGLTRKFHRFAKRGRGDGQASACCASLVCICKANASQGAQAYLTVRSELAKQAALEAPWPRSTRRIRPDLRPQP